MCSVISPADRSIQLVLEELVNIFSSVWQNYKHRTLVQYAYVLLHYSRFSSREDVHVVDEDLIKRVPFFVYRISGENHSTVITSPRLHDCCTKLVRCKDYHDHVTSLIYAFSYLAWEYQGARNFV